MFVNLLKIAKHIVPVTTNTKRGEWNETKVGVRCVVSVFDDLSIVFLHFSDGNKRRQ